jgi:predicted GH43/DUF377 family glycosyl hydrolase
LEQPTVRLTIHYGGADTVKALVLAKMDEVIDFVNTNSALLAI